MKHLKKYFVLLLCVFCLLTQTLKSQDKKSKVQFNGDIGLYGDFYSMVSDTNGAVPPRRPGATGRLVFNASLSYKAFSMPISVSFSEGQTSVVLPHYDRSNIIRFIKDPTSNNFGIAPKYKWIQAFLGTQVMKYSELSVGDIPIFGAGFALTPGKFRFSCFTGASQQAIEEDTAKHIQGVFSHKLYMVKIGYGKEEASHIYLISTGMAEWTKSLKKRPINTMPQEGWLNSLDYRINLGKEFYMKGEIAASIFTRNTHSKAVNEDNPVISSISPIFPILESTHFDYASLFSIAKDCKNFGIKLNAKYIGDGFVPLGYPYMQTDRMEATINPHCNLYKSKVTLSGSYGRQINNLSGSRAATTSQAIGNLDANAQITDKFSVAASFSNCGFRNTITNDTFRIQNVSSSWSLSPTYILTTLKNLHAISFSYSQNVFTDYNTVSEALNANNSLNALLSYMISKVKNPFNASVVLSYFNNKISFGLLSTQSASLNVGYKFFTKRLSATAGLTYAKTELDSKSAGTQLATNLGLKYSLYKKINFSLVGTINLFKYGIDRPDISYRENLLRTSITYKIK